MAPLILESCHSTWLFDEDRMRFRRILKGADVEHHRVRTDWRPYYGLRMGAGSESFAVVLSEDGSRLLQSWRHTGDCSQCGGHLTSELPLDELLAAVAR